MLVFAGMLKAVRLIYNRKMINIPIIVMTLDLLVTQLYIYTHSYDATIANLNKYVLYISIFPGNGNKSEYFVYWCDQVNVFGQIVGMFYILCLHLSVKECLCS